MSKNLIKVNSDADIIEAQKNLEEPFVILVKDGNKLIYQDDSHCDAVILIDDWNNYHAELPVVQRDISWIKGRRCLVKKTADGVAICYLDENNSELFHDGTTVAKLDGSMGQWMTDLPEFNIQCTEGESDWVKLHISKDREIGHKSRRVLVGTVMATKRNDQLWSSKYTLGTNSRLRPYTTTSNRDCHNEATNLGEGFGIIDYETHCKVAYMFMAKYKSKNPQEMEIFGTGSLNPTSTYVGNSTILGNTDGKYGDALNIMGIENWYSGTSEWLSGIHGQNISNRGIIYYIYDGFYIDQVPTGPHRIIEKDYITGPSETGYISRLEWGEYSDLVPMELSGSSKYFYADYSYISAYQWSIAQRGSTYGNMTERGLFSLSFIQESTANQSPTRIQYRGKIEVIEDIQEFINLPVGF